MQSKFRFVRFPMSVLISFAFYSFAVSDVVDECSPRCWNPVKPNSNVYGGIEQGRVTNEEECKALCVNNGTCIGVDWNTYRNGCWFQIKEGVINNNQNINYWSLANCTDDCASYCWKPVKIDLHVSGGILQSDIRDENHCKLRCSNTTNCTGIDWYTHCYLLYTLGPLTNDPGVRHWDIKRNLPTNCQGNTSSTVNITSKTVVPLQSSTKSVEDLQSPTKSLEGRSIGRTDRLISVVDECSPRCWNPVKPNSNVNGGIEQGRVSNEEECKALCVNNGTCIGVDWNTDRNGCWFQMKEGVINNNQNINYWSLANCTDECVPYCWRPVKLDLHVSGGSLQLSITDENHCKLLCSNTPNCAGIDWYTHCYLLHTAGPLTNDPGVRHWGIIRNLPTSCNASPTVTVSAASNTVEPLQSSTKSVEDLQSPTKSLEDRSIGRSDRLISGINALAVLLGLGILVIIGLVINTIRIGRKLRQSSGFKNLELDVNY